MNGPRLSIGGCLTVYLGEAYIFSHGFWPPDSCLRNPWAWASCASAPLGSVRPLDSFSLEWLPLVLGSFSLPRADSARWLARVSSIARSAAAYLSGVNDDSAPSSPPLERAWPLVMLVRRGEHVPGEFGASGRGWLGEMPVRTGRLPGPTWALVCISLALRAECCMLIAVPASPLFVLRRDGMARCSRRGQACTVASEAQPFTPRGGGANQPKRIVNRLNRHTRTIETTVQQCNLQRHFS